MRPSNSTSWLYWICQFGGWIAFVGYQMLSYSLLFETTAGWALILNGAINVILGILVTHAYRSYFILMGWLELPLPQLIPRVIVGVLAMAIILSAINIPLDKYSFPELQLDFRFPSVYSVFINWSKYILVWALIYHLFRYYRRSLESERKQYQLEALMKEVEYRQLKAQINPHFLFNALNSIRALIEVNPGLARNAITQLSDLLRSSLRMGDKKLVLLQEEMLTVNAYISLERIRFEDRLSYQSDIPEDCLSCTIPPMMLQTLVENGIKHGISKLKSGGIIYISARKKLGVLEIEVKNSGIYQQTEISPDSGYGLTNTRLRLEVLYGDKASFKILNLPEPSVLSILNIPQ